MIIKKANGHGGKKVWYIRKQDRTGTRWREYHVISLALCVTSKGSFYRLIIGPWAMSFFIRGHK